ncbi:multiheme c-type cytochrome [Pseudoalteromonas spongiae]|uniref:Multiheme c-type cytochrome n=1 Tax=Pseudoalteromonas spongiae TaxID=298657 RepID=A0ABU8ETQ0_9GAMM
MNISPPKRKRIDAVGPKLKVLLIALLVAFSLLMINSVFLGSVTFFEWLNQTVYQDYFYQLMFLGHITLGLICIIPLLLFGSLHFKNTFQRKNKRAIYVGIFLFAALILMALSGLLLIRFDFFSIKHPSVRSISYWLHVVLPFVCIWLFVLHRLVGPKIKWRIGGLVSIAAIVISLIVAVWQTQDPRQWNRVGPESGEQYFFPSLSRTSTGDFIPAKALMQDQYCLSCHSDIHEQWQNSAHKMSSFNNPAYLFSVRNTREMAIQRDGDVQAARFCAGCHDPVPFFSGAFDDPDFDDVNHPTAQQGITCTSCHAITHVNSSKGNADYTIEEPIHYPFVYSNNQILRWVNAQLIKAKPEMHKKTFLKPLHKTPDFCAGCHKVHLPKELNKYKWLRGQNHFDSYHLSGVSGHGVTSFYYPPKADNNCNGCHMPAVASNDFGAKFLDDSNQLKVHDHMFPSANTALPHLKGLPPLTNEKHRQFLQDVMEVDIFGVREGGEIDGPLLAPLEKQTLKLEAGKTYLFQVVVRTLKMGHLFTQGTADSNQVWLELVASNGNKVIGRSGGIEENEKAVDPWSHFINAYVLDRDGNKIDRRNAEDIFVPLYNNQIPPGAADVIHYKITLPDSLEGDFKLTARLNYRKFNTPYMRLFMNDKFTTNDLPVVELAKDAVVISTSESKAIEKQNQTKRPNWMRWNDYGIGLLRKPKKSQFKQAEHAFKQVSDKGKGLAELNLARIYYQEGRLEQASDALARAATNEYPAWPWTVTWFSALIDKQNGYFDAAINNFERLLNTDFNDAKARDFDFSEDYRVWVELAQTYIERAKTHRSQQAEAAKQADFTKAREALYTALKYDVENHQAYYNLYVIAKLTQDHKSAEKYRNLHEKYRPDNNAKDTAISAHRVKNPAADHAAAPVVIYDLNRPTIYTEQITTLKPLEEK